MNVDEALAEFLVVHVGDQCFGLPTACVETALAPLPVSPLPFVPAYVEGLVCINERIIPQIDLQRLLATTAVGGGEVVVVETSRSPCALRVTRIEGKAEIGAGAVQPIAQETASVLVAGRFEWQQQSVLVIDTEKLGGLVSPGELPEGARGLLGRLQTENDDTSAQVLDCIALKLGGERYAMALDDLVEILDLAPAMPVPGAPAEVEGLAMVRDEAMLVLSLARLLRLPETAGERRSVVVVLRDGVRYGLRVDGIDGIRALDEAQLRRLEEGGGELSGVVADDGSLLGLIAPERLITAATHATLLPFVPRGRRQAEAQREQHRDVLEVRLGAETFGIALDQVRRIAEYRAPEAVRGEAGNFVAGAIDIDGRVLPVVDLAACLRTENGNDGAWVIVGTDDGEWAIAVREAADIISIPESALEELVAERGGFVAAVANVGGRLLSLLTLAPLAAAARQPMEVL